MPADPVATFNRQALPIIVSFKQGYDDKVMQLTVHEAKRLRDSLIICLEGLEDGPFDFGPATKP